MKTKKKASVLLVDDDIGITETLDDILTELGYCVEVTNTGREAIERVKLRSFDVILLDIKMPGIDGVETYKIIKTIRPEAAVMMMTAYSVEDLITQALKEGACGIMYKPVDIAKLVEFITRVKASALILIVDDNLKSCKILSDVLNTKGYRTVKASNGKEAIKMVKDSVFDIVFIDVKMPVLNGFEVYMALKKIRPNIKAIMMTGYRGEVQNLIDHALENNAYACIYKPFDVEEVLKMIQKIREKPDTKL